MVMVAQPCKYAKNHWKQEASYQETVDWEDVYGIYLYCLALTSPCFLAEYVLDFVYEPSQRFSQRSQAFCSVMTLWENCLHEPESCRLWRGDFDYSWREALNELTSEVVFSPVWQQGSLTPVLIAQLSSTTPTLLSSASLGHHCHDWGTTLQELLSICHRHWCDHASHETAGFVDMSPCRE